MTKAHGYLQALLKNIETLRQESGLTHTQLEERLILGPGWISRFENGETVPSIDMVLAILHETKSSLAGLLEGLPELEASAVERCIFAEQAEDDILIHFDYAKHDAQYTLRNSTLEEFGTVIKTLRNGLSSLASSDKGQSGAIKSDAVVRTFLEAVRLWPHANPSDLWWFLVSRAYCDPFNHPAKFARLNFGQSWKRSSGWALEKILVWHYGPFLKQHGVNLFIAKGHAMTTIVQQLKSSIADRVVAAKIDVMLTGDTPKGSLPFGVVHVKASFAERRTDDQPLSSALIRGGYNNGLQKHTQCPSG